jgi:hypothetical protein
MLTPLQLEKKYHQLVVALYNGPPLTVDIRHYRMRGSANYDTGDAETGALGPLLNCLPGSGRYRGVPFDGTVAKDKHRPSSVPARKPGPQKDNHEPKYREQIDTYALSHTFMGKGMPADIALTLKLAVHFGLVKGTTVELQKYCENYIGLDCSGFVWSYAKAVGDTKVPEDVIDYAVGKNVRKKLADVQARDVLVWSDLGHIAMIDSIEPPGDKTKGASARALVVESTASRVGSKFNGPQVSEYHLSETKDKGKWGQLFPVVWGNGTPATVYIADLGFPR